MSGEPLPRIVGVAIKYEGEVHKLPAPNRHHHVIREIARKNGVGIKGPDRQGFYDDAGQFLSRRKAMSLAKRNGQLLPGGRPSDELYSEDLW